MNSRFCRLAVLLSCLGGALWGADPHAEIAAVIKADAIRLESMMKGSGLDAVFSEELVFVHSDGRVEGKNEYIKNLTAGETAYRDVKTSNVQAKRIARDVVVLTGAQEMQKKLGPTWSRVSLRFLSVWRRETDSWRIVAWQSARPAGNSVVPLK